MNCMAHVLQDGCCDPGEFVPSAVWTVASPRVYPLNILYHWVQGREFLYWRNSSIPLFSLHWCFLLAASIRALLLQVTGTGAEETALGCTRGGLDCISGKISSQKGLSSINTSCPGKWTSWRCWKPRGCGAWAHGAECAAAGWTSGP